MNEARIAVPRSDKKRERRKGKSQFYARAAERWQGYRGTERQPKGEGGEEREGRRAREGRGKGEGKERREG